MPVSIDRLRQLMEPILAEQKRAKELTSQIPEDGVFVAVCTVEVPGDPCPIVPDLLQVRRVTNPPGFLNLLRAADPDFSAASAAARYASHIRAEIVSGFAGADQWKAEELTNIAWHAAALMKLKSSEMLYCPAVAEVSWDVIAAITSRRVRVRLLDDVPRQLRLDPASSQVLSQTDLDWIARYFEQSLRLRGRAISRRFGLAYQLAYTWNQTSDPRSALTALWSALDALFGSRHDNSRAVIDRMTGWLAVADRTPVRTLYEHRCDAVHGRAMPSELLSDTLRASYDLLRHSLLACIERGAVPRADWNP